MEALFSLIGRPNLTIGRRILRLVIQFNLELSDDSGVRVERLVNAKWLSDKFSNNAGLK